MESKSKLNSLEQGIVDGLLERKGPELLRLLEEQTEPQTCCYQSLLLDGHELLDMSDLVFVKLMLEPDKCLHKLDSLLAVALARLRESNPGPPVDRVHLRIRSLPDLPEFQRQVVPRSGRVADLAGGNRDKEGSDEDGDYEEAGQLQQVPTHLSRPRRL
jgi:hypothetical protein